MARDCDGRLFWGLLAVSLALRLPGMFHDFWLDEAWSYLLVRQFVTSPLDILTRVPIDNNHPLNSWFLYMLGEQSAVALYRVPSLVFGVGSVALAGGILWRRGRPHGIAAMMLVGCSYPLIVYASEARGYAAMVFFVLLAIDAHERYLASGRRLALLTFWIASSVGFLAHLTFVHAYTAILLWSAYHAHTRSGAWHETLVKLATWHALPLASLAAFYLVFVRHLQIAGAEPAGLLRVLGDTVAVTVGTPAHDAWPWIALAILGAMMGAGLRTIRKADPALWILFVAGILVMPALTVVIEMRTALMEPRFFPRYFLVSITLFLLAAAWLVGEHYRRGGRTRLVAVTLISACAVGNLWQVVNFMGDGRGDYQEAVRYMSSATSGPVIRVSSNSDFRTGVLLAFHGRYLPPDKTLTLYPGVAASDGALQWRILEDLAPNPAMPELIDDGQGPAFRFVKRFPFYGLSGAQWSLYQRVDTTGDFDTGAAR
jgi:hypothetical protein